MRIEQDYVIRLIHEVVRALLKLLFNIDESKEEEIFEAQETAQK